MQKKSPRKSDRCADFGTILQPSCASTNGRRLNWPATTDADVASFAWSVDFVNGDVGFDDKTDARHVWCVRGGQGVDPQ